MFIETTFFSGSKFSFLSVYINLNGAFDEQFNSRSTGWKLSFELLGSLKEQRRRRLRKRLLKIEFELPKTLSRLFHLVYIVIRQMWTHFLLGVEF